MLEKVTFDQNLKGGRRVSKVHCPGRTPVGYGWNVERREGQHTQSVKLGRAPVDKIREMVEAGQITVPGIPLQGLGMRF